MVVLILSIIFAIFVLYVVWSSPVAGICMLSGIALLYLIISRNDKKHK